MNVPKDQHAGTVRIIVLGLVLLAALALGLLGAVALLERQADEVVVGALVGVLGTAVGAVASLLAQTGRGSVQIEQPEGRPVPVEPQYDDVED